MNIKIAELNQSYGSYRSKPPSNPNSNLNISPLTLAQMPFMAPIRMTSQNERQLVVSDGRTKIPNLEAVDSNFYRRAYKDLKPSTDPVSHFFTHGRRENRLPNADKFYSLYPDFDQQTYVMNSPDLKNLSAEELLSHFHRHGRMEGRTYQKKGTVTGLKSYENNLGNAGNIANSMTNANLNTNINQVSEMDVNFRADVTRKLADLESQYEARHNRQYLDDDGLKKIDIFAINQTYEIGLDEKLRAILNHRQQSGTNKPVYLVMAEWGYPPFGGGECWLMDTMKWLHGQGFSCYYIYFYDNVKRCNFTKVDTIDIEYGSFIQFPQNYLELFQFIKLLNPRVISHQGLNRMKYLQIANLLDKPFITGFCFWSDILKLDPKTDPMDPYNKNMLNKALLGDPNFKIICNESSCAYVCGHFVNDVIKKVHNMTIDVINTITDDTHYRIEPQNPEEAVYVTVINICGLKGGHILESIINCTGIHIPFLLVDSQDSDNPLNLKLEKLIQMRNQYEKTHKSIYIKGAQHDIKSIYQKTKILLTPSLVDETFCRVAYEGMMNNLPIISTMNGNLKYILKGYADYLTETPIQWAQKINDIYEDETYLTEMRGRAKPIDPTADKEKFVEQVYRCITNRSIRTIENKNIGIFCPWGDQGLGIQCREYYEIFRKLGYIVNIFSFKPYHSTPDNPRLQTDPSEWNYPNIYYSQSTRESVSLNEVINFIHQYKVKKMIIVETCFNRVFEIAQVCRLLSVTVYAIPNIETMRSAEISRHNLYDKILCNNQSTYDLLSIYYPEKTELLGFRILNRNYSTEKQWNKSHYSFFCSGGMNALTRKNIDRIVIAFKELESEKQIRNFKLYIYIQGVEIPDNYAKFASSNVIISVGSRSYKEIAQLYKKHDIFVHMGDHEGLGLGLYESIVCGTPVITIDTPPNNEIIKEGRNGWLVPCTYEKLNDNPDGIVRKAVVQARDIKAKMSSIIETYNRKTNHEKTTQDYAMRYPINLYTDQIKKIFN